MVIKNLEGGYYHPNMLKDGRVNDPRYSSSGETMFGIDRKQGGTINTSEAGVKFWRMIDNANARNVWKWNYLGGELAPSLRDLAGEMMYPHFNELLRLYASPSVVKAIENDDRLLFNFIYASWNGSGWFAKWAKDLDRYLSTGSHSKDEILRFALNLRTNEGYKVGSAPNSLIKQGGEKIKGFINDLFAVVKDDASEIKTQATGNPLATIIILLAIGVVVFLISKNN